MTDLIWTQSFTVRGYETDATGALSPHTLCDFLQEAAGGHAGTYGVSVGELLSRNLTWILSRLRLRIERHPAAGETLHVRTWPAGIDRLFALRDFQVVDTEGKTVAAAASAWLILDTKARRPVRIQNVFSMPDTSGMPRALAEDPVRLAELGPGGREARFAVRFSDIDWNRHVNNASYVEWIVESAGGEVAEKCRVSSLAVDFLAEAVYGDVVAGRACRQEGDGLSFRHSLRVESRAVPGDLREIARAETRWVEL